MSRALMLAFPVSVACCSSWRFLYKIEEIGFPRAESLMNVPSQEVGSYTGLLAF
jgi:hypothetical protein